MASGAAAAATVGEKASDLNRKYAPASLGGTGADAAYRAAARTGAGPGADPAPRGEVEGLMPAVGMPKDAPVEEAATGGKAASIAGVAAAVASGTPESSAAQVLSQVRQEMVLMLATTCKSAALTMQDG